MRKHHGNEQLLAELNSSACYNCSPWEAIINSLRRISRSALRRCLRLFDVEAVDRTQNSKPAPNVKRENAPTFFACASLGE